jgi:rod shape-determining protein MreD
MMVFIKYLLLALVGISLQSVLFRTVKPDIIIILVCFYTLRYGQFRGVAYGALTGLILDSASGIIIGPNILSKISAVFFVSFIRRKVFFWGPAFNALMVLAVSLLDILLVRICLETFTAISYSSRLPVITIMQVVLTSVFSLAMYPFFNTERDEGNIAG